MFTHTEEFLKSLTLAQWLLLARAIPEAASNGAQLFNNVTHPGISEMHEIFALQKQGGANDEDAAIAAGRSGYNETVLYHGGPKG